MTRQLLLLFIAFYFNSHVSAQKKFFIRIYTIGSSGVIRGLYLGYTDSTDPNCQLCGIIDNSFRTTQSEDAVAGAFLGAVAGTAAGTVIGLTKRRETLIVAGDFQKWKSIRTRLDAWPVHKRGSDNR